MAQTDATLCRECHREIRFLLTKRGRWMPVDVVPEEIVKTKSNKGKMFYLPDGAMVRGRKADETETGIMAYTPHFVTCPARQPKREKRISNGAELLEAARRHEEERAKEIERVKQVERAIAEKEREWRERQTSLFGN